MKVYLLMVNTNARRQKTGIPEIHNGNVVYSSKLAMRVVTNTLTKYHDNLENCRYKLGIIETQPVKPEHIEPFISYAKSHNSDRGHHYISVEAEFDNNQFQAISFYQENGEKVVFESPIILSIKSSRTYDFFMQQTIADLKSQCRNNPDDKKLKTHYKFFTNALSKEKTSPTDKDESIVSTNDPKKCNLL